MVLVLWARAIVVGISRYLYVYVYCIYEPTPYCWSLAHARWTLLGMVNKLGIRESNGEFMGCRDSHPTGRTKTWDGSKARTNTTISGGIDIHLNLPSISGWWFGTFFPYIGNVIIPTDFHIFQRG